MKTANDNKIGRWFTRPDLLKLAFKFYDELDEASAVDQVFKIRDRFMDEAEAMRLAPALLEDLLGNFAAATGGRVEELMGC
jgi:hypothetical protein